jgi:hypothetical protein
MRLGLQEVVPPRESCGRGRRIDDHDRLEARAPMPHIRDGGHEVAPAERLLDHQNLRRRVVDDELDLAHPVARRDAGVHGAEGRDGEDGGPELVAVREHDGDAVARRHPESCEPAGHPCHRVGVLTVRPRRSSVPLNVVAHGGRPARERRGGVRQVLRQRDAAPQPGPAVAPDLVLGQAAVRPRQQLGFAQHHALLPRPQRPVTAHLSWRAGAPGRSRAG